MSANQAEISVRSLCTTLGVSHSGYYDWHGRAPCTRAQANIALTEQIKAAHAASDATYGMPRIRAELADQGVMVSRKRIARLMRQAKLAGVSRRRAWCVTTQRNKRHRPAPDLVNRQFVATDINQLWVADMTYIPTWQGFVYLAVITDVFSRKVVGWAFGEQMTADLVIAALNMALPTRKPESVIHTTAIKAASTQAWRLVNAARRWACARAWVRWAMLMTTRWRKASLPVWNVNSSSGASGRAKRKRAWISLLGN